MLAGKLRGEKGGGRSMVEMKCWWIITYFCVDSTGHRLIDFPMIDWLLIGAAPLRLNATRETPNYAYLFSVQQLSYANDVDLTDIYIYI